MTRLALEALGIGGPVLAPETSGSSDRPPVSPGVWRLATWSKKSIVLRPGIFQDKYEEKTHHNSPHHCGVFVFLLASRLPASVVRRRPPRLPLISRNSSHTQLISHTTHRISYNSSLTQLIASHTQHHSSHTTHLTQQLISHTTHLTHNSSHTPHLSHTTHLFHTHTHHKTYLTYLIHNSSHTQLISHTTHLTHNSSHTPHLTDVLLGRRSTQSL